MRFDNMVLYIKPGCPFCSKVMLFMEENGIDSYVVLLASRVLEGCAFAFVAIAGVVFVNIWFPNKNTGLFVGIFMTFISIGSIVALNCMIPLTTAYGLASAWWVTAIVSAVMTAVFLFVVGEAPVSDAGSG